MSKTLKIFLVAVLVTTVSTQEKVCDHLGFGQAAFHDGPFAAEPASDVGPSDSISGSSHFVNDTIYQWDEYMFDWVASADMPIFEDRLVDSASLQQVPISEPIEINWRLLMEIKYRLRYFADIDMEMYSPVFGEAVEALHEKEVIIKGFVIPIDEEENMLALSFSPYSSCFFCGKGSPASVISMYMKTKKKRYKLDDVKRFKGILHLNHDDPDEFYYVLRDVTEVK